MAESILTPPPRRDVRPPVDKPVAAVNPLVSILIPCCGMLEYTKLCVPSILKYSRQPYELIFLDIGSLDGTAEYLAGVATVHPSIRVEIVRTQTDLGIGDACRDALARARGEYLVLLNNDTVVTSGWLNQLTSLINTSPSLGMVGPMSNYAAEGQLVETVPYRIGPRKYTRHGQTEALVDVTEVETFACEFREKHKGNWLHTDRLGGFCVMLKRELYKRLDNQGQLAQWGDLALFDTDILGVKAREAGFNLAICRDLFVHHFGTRTFAHGAPTPDDRRAGEPARS